MIMIIHNDVPTKLANEVNAFLTILQKELPNSNCETRLRVLIIIIITSSPQRNFKIAKQPLCLLPSPPLPFAANLPVRQIIDPRFRFQLARFRERGNPIILSADYYTVTVTRGRAQYR